MFLSIVDYQKQNILNDHLPVGAWVGPTRRSLTLPRNKPTRTTSQREEIVYFQKVREYIRSKHRTLRNTTFFGDLLGYCKAFTIAPQASHLYPGTSSAASGVLRENQALQSNFANLTARMSEFWHKIGCCVAAKPPPRKRRRKIDRSMIGEPTNFVHLTHIGSGEMADGLQPSGSVQDQMRSKGPSSNRTRTAS